MIEDVSFDSQLFTVKKLAGGVYALIEREDRTGSNAGIIDLGNKTVVFDTFLNIDAALDMKRACVELTGRMPSYVIVSHRHMDHIIGSCLFPDSAILCSPATRDAVAATKAEFDKEKHEYGPRAEEIRELLKTESDETKIANLKNELSFVANMAKPHAAVRVPDVTFDKEIVLHGDERSLYLRAYPAGHSRGDVAAFLPEDKTVFAGDLLFIERHPWIGTGDPAALIDILEGFMEMDIEHFVPGHGRMAEKPDVALLIRYVREIIALAERRRGETEPVFSIEELSPEFREWRSLCFQWNMDFLMGRKRG